MAIDKFLAGYRDYLYTKDVMLDSIDHETTESEIYVVTVHCIHILNELRESFAYLDEHLEVVEKEIDDLFSNIYGKLDRVVELAEGYQNLNTHELINDEIKQFSSFEIKFHKYFDEYLKGLTLKRISKLKSIEAIEVYKSNKEAKEVFNIVDNNDSFFVKINLIDSTNTNLKRVIVNYADKPSETIFDNALINLKSNSESIEVITDNIDKDVPRYTNIDLISGTFDQELNLTLQEKTFKKEEELLKLAVDHNLVNSSKITLKTSFKYIDETTGKFKTDTVYTSLDGSREVLLHKKDSISTLPLKDIYGNPVSFYEVSDGDLVLSPEYSTNKESVRYLGNNVFNIKGINAKEFSVSISIYMNNLENNYETPVIKGIYGYVTNQL